MTLFAKARPGRAAPLAVVALLTGATSALLGVCGPFTDVAADSFCPFVLEVFYLGITTGTTPTTYDPAGNVSRLQMAAFLSRTVDGTLKRGGRRAALRQFWTTQGETNLALTTVGSSPAGAESDGTDVWVASVAGSVARVRASDGKLLDTWTGATNATIPISAMGRVFVTGQSSPGLLFRIDPTLPAGVVTTVASNLGNQPTGIAYDGSRIWTANFSGSVSIVTPGAAIPWTVMNALGFSGPAGILYDGGNIWVTNTSIGTIQKLDALGGVLQTVTVGSTPVRPVFDGTNLWVPNAGSNSISVVRASSGAVLATLTGNGMSSPAVAGFDGQRVLVTNFEGQSVSLWKAADLTTIGTFSTGADTSPGAVCSDGISFFVTLSGPSQLARF